MCQYEALCERKDLFSPGSQSPLFCLLWAAEAEDPGTRRLLRSPAASSVLAVATSARAVGSA